MKISFLIPLLTPFFFYNNTIAITEKKPDYISWAEEKGILKNYHVSSLDNILSRSDTIKILVEYKYNNKEINTCRIQEFGFSNISKDNKYYKHICFAKKKGIISGYTDGLFYPDKSVNLAEFSKIASLILIDYGIKPSFYGYWYNNYLLRLSLRNVIPKSITSPSQYINIKQLIEMMYRLENKESLIEYSDYKNNKYYKNIHFFDTYDNSFKTKNYLNIGAYRVKRPENQIPISSHYATARNRIFYYGTDYKGRSEVRIIEGVNSNNFRVLGDNFGVIDNVVVMYGSLERDIDYHSFKVLSTNYSKDRNNIYYKGKVLEGADINTFTIDDFLREKASDKNRLY